jgi:hypothetical protein
MRRLLGFACSFSPAGLAVAKQTIANYIEKASRLYEQERSTVSAAAALEMYVRRWLRWAKGGLRPGIRNAIPVKIWSIAVSVQSHIVRAFQSAGSYVQMVRVRNADGNDACGSVRGLTRWRFDRSGRDWLLRPGSGVGRLAWGTRGGVAFDYGAPGPLSRGGRAIRDARLL